MASNLALSVTTFTEKIESSRGQLWGANEGVLFNFQKCFVVPQVIFVHKGAPSIEMRFSRVQCHVCFCRF